MQLALEAGWELATPVSEGSVWDALLNRGFMWERVQVKRVWHKAGHPVVNMVRGDGERYKSTDAEWLAAVEVESGRTWLIPFTEVAGVTRKRLTADLDQYLLFGASRAEES
jgi:hypothetical protein